MSRTLRASLGFSVVSTLLIAIAALSTSDTDTADTSLDSLVTPAEKEFLLEQLARVSPPERLRELAGYGQRQLELGGGFYGMLPDQLADPESIPLPADAEGRLDAALCLARQRAVNLEALRQINEDYTLTFSGESLPAFLDRIRSRSAAHDESVERLRLELDTSALDGFFDALADGRVSMDEATTLASLPSNLAMLEHRRNLGYVPEPLPDADSLAEMIRMAGSSDPLDRLWCWINPQNAFGYADLELNAAGYSRFLSELRDHRQRLVTAVVSQIADYAPADVRFEARFAFTVGWAIRGWATPEMAGLNLEQVKDDWDPLFGTLVEESYHRLQLQLCPTTEGEPAREFDDLVEAETGDEGYDRLYEIVAYTVLEGAANLVRGPFAATDLPDKAPAGAELMSRFVERVVENGDVESADALISEGLKGNGPLYGLGWELASRIAEKDGKRAVGEYQALGPVAFFLRGATLADGDGSPLLAPGVVAAVETLRSRLTR